MTTTKLLNAFVELASIIRNTSEYHDSLAKFLLLIGDITNASRSVVYLLDDSKRYLYAEQLYSQGSVVASKQIEKISLGNALDNNVFSYAAHNGKAVWIDDVYRVSGFNVDCVLSLDSVMDVKTNSFLAMPIINNKGELFGVVQLSDIDKKYYMDPELSQTIKSFVTYSSSILEGQRYRHENLRLLRLLETTNRDLNEENIRLKNSLKREEDTGFYQSRCESMKAVAVLIDKVAPSDATVLITGETGTGKESVAQSIHRKSHRVAGEFIVQNCAALPENLLESELFGYKKGAFSGATSNKQGLIAKAHDGTMFLDEVAELPLSLQAKLLRVLQEKEIRPLGSTETQQVNVRFVAATHKNLNAMVMEGTFREDLFYRLNMFPVELPSLKNRKADISGLIMHFVVEFTNLYKKNIKAISPQYLESLENYHFPGNIRELKNIVERGIILVDDKGALTLEHLPAHVREAKSTPAAIPLISGSLSKGLKQVVERYEANVIKEKLAQCQWNQSKTAVELKIGRRTLIDKINRYQINRHN